MLHAFCKKDREYHPHYQQIQKRRQNTPEHPQRSPFILLFKITLYQLRKQKLVFLYLFDHKVLPFSSENALSASGHLLITQLTFILYNFIHVNTDIFPSFQQHVLTASLIIFILYVPLFFAYFYRKTLEKNELFLIPFSQVYIIL